MSSQSKQDLPDGSKTCCEEEEKIHVWWRRVGVTEDDTRDRVRGRQGLWGPIKGADEIHYARKTLQITKFLHGGKQNE